MFAESLVISAIVVLVGVGGFGLGRLTILQEQKGHLTIHAPAISSSEAKPTPLSANNSDTKQPVTLNTHNFVASKNGSKYYKAGCTNANRIKVANQVWFESAAAAISAGYKAASNCSPVQ